MPPASKTRLYRIEQMSEIARSKATARPESSSRSAAKRWWRRASWPGDSRLRGAGNVSQQVSSTVETAFRRGHGPAIVACAFAPNRLRRRRDWSQPARIQAAWGRFAFGCLAWGKLGPCSILYRPLPAASAGLQRYEPLSQGDRIAFEHLLFSRSVKGAPFVYAPSRSAGRGVPCLLSNRPARLPRKWCVRHAAAICDLPSSNRITTASAWTTTPSLAANAMKFRRMYSTVPRRLAPAPVVKCVRILRTAGWTSRPTIPTLVAVGLTLSCCGSTQLYSTTPATPAVLLHPVRHASAEELPIGRQHSTKTSQLASSWNQATGRGSMV
jgi:hypothetical protein